MGKRAEIARGVRSTRSRPYDLVLIGAGPCGLAAAAEFRRAGLRYIHLEAGDLAQTVRNYPHKVRLFSTRDRLEIGGIRFGPRRHESPTREEFLAYLRRVTKELGLRVRLHTPVVQIRSRDGVHLVEAERPGGAMLALSTRNIVVASGGYFSPHLLGIPGEDAPHVSHYVRTFERHRGMRVLIVGGRNSAVEAATAFARCGAHVILAYRGARIPRKRIKPWLLPPFDAARAEGRIAVYLRTVPRAIRGESVDLVRADGEHMRMPADAVYLLTGYGPDYEVLRRAGVPFHARTGRPLFNPRTLETKVPGIFLCGTVVLTWRGGKASIENTKDHGRVILEAMR